jgi:hypothetical protein
MAIINNVNEVLHRIRAKLYPYYLHGVDGAYIARTDDEVSLSIEEACQKATPFGLGVGARATSTQFARRVLPKGKTLMQSGHAGLHGCGVYFVDAANPAQKMKVAGHLADNTASRIVGIIPALGAGQWRVEVVTQYTGNANTALKNPRTLTRAVVLTVA